VKSVPASLTKQIAAVWEKRPHTPTLISVALRLNYTPATPDALKLLTAKETSSGDRKAILQLLSEREVEAAVPAILQLLKGEKKDATKVELLSALAHFNTPEIAESLLSYLPGASNSVRGTIVAALSRRADWARALLEKVDRGEVKKEAVTPADLFSMENLGDPVAKKLVAKIYGNIRPSSQAKEQRITQVRSLVAAHNGSADKGHELFKTRCAICHTLNGEGAKIGPELTGYERDNLDFMIPAIVDPSLGIREEFTAFMVTTNKGQALVGLITENDPKMVTVMDITGNKTRIAREDIKTLNALPTSLMPEGLLDTMSDAEVKDLFAYLMKK
jgi:putative heme-binding domain-containing protein